MTHLFLCFSPSSEPQQRFKFQDGAPSEQPHPALLSEKIKGAKNDASHCLLGLVGMLEGNFSLDNLHSRGGVR